MMRYRKIDLRTAANFTPGWAENNTGHLPYRDSFGAPAYTVTREKGDDFYTVTHVETGVSAEVHGSNVLVAVLEPTAPVLVVKGARKS